MNTKWYVYSQSAEGEAYAIVELSDEEYELWKKLESKLEWIYCEDYAGSSGFDQSFDSKEEAVRFILENAVIRKDVIDEYRELYDQVQKEVWGIEA